MGRCVNAVHANFDLLTLGRSDWTQRERCDDMSEEALERLIIIIILMDVNISNTFDISTSHRGYVLGPPPTKDRSPAKERERGSESIQILK